MIRKLTFVMDDDAKVSHIEGVDSFTLTELLGVAEHINVWARVEVIKNMQAAKKAAAEATTKPKRRSRKTGEKK